MKSSKLLIGIIVVVLLAGVVGAVVWQQQANQTHNVRIAFNSWVGYAPFYVAQEKGYFAKRGLDVDIQVIEEVESRRADLIAGRLDALGTTLDDLVVSAAQGVPIKMVLGLDESAGADGILAPQDVSSVSDFQGRTIAVQPGFVNHFFLLYILDDNGLTAQDVEVRPMDPDRAAEAFVEGEVDIAVTWEPHLSEVKKNRPDGKTFLTTSDYPGLVVDILVFRDDFIEDNPDVVADFVDAWYEALDFVESNPDEAYQIMGEATGIDSAELVEILSGVKFLKQQDNLQYHSRSQEVNVFAIVSTASKLWQTEGYIAQPIDPNSYVDTSFLEGAEGSKGLFGF